MQFSRIALVAALAAPALAIIDTSLISKLPSCAISAASSALTGGACGTDIECACKDSSFIASLSTAVKAVCSDADVTKTIDVAKELCLSVGVTVQIPDDGAAAPSSTAAPVAASPTSDVTVPTSAAEPVPTSTVDACAAIPPASVRPSASYNGTGPTPTKLRPTVEFTAAAAMATGHIAAGVIGVAGFLAFL